MGSNPKCSPASPASTATVTSIRTCSANTSLLPAARAACNAPAACNRCSTADKPRIPGLPSATCHGYAAAPALSAPHAACSSSIQSARLAVQRPVACCQHVCRGLCAAGLLRCGA
uniref:Uncharacterized protein n=1 Tax=Arundo donax TaxID=35708 RepID=A0A0A9GN69_ARUDO